MILGILSDTHGFARRAAAAMRILEHKGATAFIHCGDIGGEEVLDELIGRQAWCVFGNTDAQDGSLRRYAESIGVLVADGPLVIEMKKKQIAIFHGHETRFSQLTRVLRLRDHSALVALTQGWDYVCYGHTHHASDIRVGRMRLINPGALERARVRTIATLDLDQDELAYWCVDEFASPDEAPRRVYPRDLA